MKALVVRLFDRKARATRKEAQNTVKEARKLLRRAKREMSQSVQDDVTAAIEAVSEARREHKVDAIHKASDKLGNLVEKHLAGYRKPAWRESFENIAVAVLIALLLRSFVVEAFKIPSGSMIPTLAIGDQIFVNKFTYGIRVPFTSIRIVDFAMPERGDVVVFVVPIEPHEDYIKRVVGLPGDEIWVHKSVLYVNGKAVPRKSLGSVKEDERDGVDGVWHSFEALAYEESLDGKQYTVLRDANASVMASDYGPYVVPKGHVFVMGDNRDRSFDSRAWGPVPLSNILGRSMFVWWSWGKDGLNTKRLGTWID